MRFVRSVLPALIVAVALGACSVTAKPGQMSNTEARQVSDFLKEKYK